jgi:hypothetical protein
MKQEAKMKIIKTFIIIILISLIFQNVKADSINPPSIFLPLILSNGNSQQNCIFAIRFGAGPEGAGLDTTKIFGGAPICKVVIYPNQQAYNIKDTAHAITFKPFDDGNEQYAISWGGDIAVLIYPAYPQIIYADYYIELP